MLGPVVVPVNIGSRNDCHMRAWPCWRRKSETLDYWANPDPRIDLAGWDSLSGLAARDYTYPGGTMPAAQPAPAPATEVAQPPFLPTLTGEFGGEYKARPSAFLVSYLINVVVGALLIWSSHWVFVHKQEIKQHVVSLVTDVSPYVLPSSKKEVGGGGGGGDRDKLQASKGSPPKFTLKQLAPPAVVVRNENPKLPVDPSVLGPPQIQLPQLAAVGDPLSKIMGPPSNGIGSNGGIGSGCCGGVGPGHGRGVGPGEEAGIGGGLYRVGGGVSAPRAIFQPDPEYSEEARKAKYQGTVTLIVIVGADGRPHEMRVSRSLGLGLDEKALEAVRTWRFEPARKDGQPVSVQIAVEVTFRLY